MWTPECREQFLFICTRSLEPTVSTRDLLLLAVNVAVFPLVCTCPSANGYSLKGFLTFLYKTAKEQLVSVTLTEPHFI